MPAYNKPFKQTLPHQSSERLAACGLMHHDHDAITPCQRECNRRLSMTIQVEQEAYMTQHPEIPAMLELFLSKMMLKTTRTSFLEEGIKYFTRPATELDQEIRKRLNIHQEGPYNQGRPMLLYCDDHLEKDLLAIVNKQYPPEPWSISSSEKSPPDTVSSSFLSARSSDTTVPTPEPVPIPPPTTEEVFYGMVSNVVDKAIYLRVDEQALRYDFAYVEVAKSVEEAMEIPVIEIRADIAQLFNNAYEMFELIILEQERIAAEIAWDKRMRKKMKKMLRRQDNFKGWQTPPDSEPSSHESYRMPPQRPCECHPQFHYNRYDKDRYGIYLPHGERFRDINVTITPEVVSLEDVTAATEEKEPEKK